jgi:hypothetical protein
MIGTQQWRRSGSALKRTLPRRAWQGGEAEDRPMSRIPMGAGHLDHRPVQVLLRNSAGGFASSCSSFGVRWPSSGEGSQLYLLWVLSTRSGGLRRPWLISFTNQTCSMIRQRIWPGNILWPPS